MVKVPEADFVPAYFMGQLEGPKIEAPIEIAISLNGKIVCTTRTSRNPKGLRQWTALVREEVLNSTTENARFFEIERLYETYVLHEFFDHGLQ